VQRRATVISAGLEREAEAEPDGLGAAFLGGAVTDVAIGSSELVDVHPAAIQQSLGGRPVHLQASDEEDVDLRPRPSRELPVARALR